MCSGSPSYLIDSFTSEKSILFIAYELNLYSTHIISRISALIDRLVLLTLRDFYTAAENKF